MRHWEEVWRFDTARFAVVAEVTDCEDSPSDQLDEESCEDIRNGRVRWFDARVRVLDSDGEEMGADYLGCCAYRSAVDLFRDHATGTKEARALRRKHASILQSMRRTRDKWPRSRRALVGMLEEAREVREDLARVNKMLRNNALLNPPVSYCTYGPDMVRSAIAEARATMARRYAEVTR